MNNESFICVNCGKTVEPAKIGIRNHCPHCLHSVHTDIFLNDNANSCHGLMRPVAMEIKNDKPVILFKCSICDKVIGAPTALDDNYDEILKLYKK